MKVESRESRVESQTRRIALRAGTPHSTLHTPHSGQPPRRGITLIELLVVIIILTTIVAAAIPILAPADDDRRLRETSRTLNTYITGAQTRAIAHNRPFGIALKRLSQDTKRPEDNGVCLEIFYVEQQPPYAGFDANSRARVSLYSASSPSAYGGATALVLIQFVTRPSDIEIPRTVDSLPTGWDVDELPGVRSATDTGGLIRPGDVIEINGTRYQLLGADSRDDNIDVRLDASGAYYRFDTGRVGAGKPTQVVALALNDSGQMLNVTHDEYGAEVANPTLGKSHDHFFTYPAPYKILRQATPTSDEPYQLPEGTAIDLRASGVGSNDYFYWPGIHDNPYGVLIMFAPEGRISRVSFNRLSNNEPFDQSVVENVYLLIGKRENVPAPAVGDDPTLDSAKVAAATTDQQRQELREPINWLAGTSRWVVIGSQSGRIATIENAFVDLPKVTTLGTPSEQLRTQQILAAREFTRQMAQLRGR